MPHTVTHEIAARYLQKGDVVNITGTWSKPLVQIDKKQKYVWLEDEAGTEGRLEMGHVVAVQRVEDTPEEKNAKYRATQVKRYITKMSGVLASIDLAREEYFATVTSQVTTTHWETERFVEAQEIYLVWARVQHVMEKKDVDILEAMKIVANTLLRNLLAATRGSGRSTNTMSNAFEDVKNGVASNFIQDVQEL